MLDRISAPLTSLLRGFYDVVPLAVLFGVTAGVTDGGGLSMNAEELEVNALPLARALSCPMSQLPTPLASH